jgi:hypothetical protein
MRGMSLAELTLAQWRSLDASAARRIADRAARLTDGRVVAVEPAGHAGDLHRVRIERDGVEFALIPGGPVTLGLDPDVWRPAPGQEADYARSLEQGFGRGPDLRAHLAGVLSPRREAVLPAVLMAVEAEELDGPAPEAAAGFSDRGLRLPSPDEWEHACAAGAETLFRWGDECPLDRVPYDDATGPQSLPNAFGLLIAHDSYSAELSSDPGSIHGGDGGESVCGGYGALLGWLPLATANRNPDMANFAYGPDGEDMYDCFGARPVIPL